MVRVPGVTGVTGVTGADASSPSSPSSPPPHLQLHDVSVAFHTDTGIKPVLNDISLRIWPGEWLAVVGRNGSGKSTLARVLAGLCGVSKGQVHRSDATGPTAVQMVFQNPDAQIVGETVDEDIRFGLENSDVPQAQMADRVADALRLAGLDVPLEQPVETLSGGQKQRLCIASALSVDASVLVFDESTAMLDSALRQHLHITVRSLCDAGRSVVWITQRLDELSRVDRVVALADGRMAFSGTAVEFFDGPCAALGFPLPYLAAVSQALAARGITTTGPLSADAVAQAVVQSCR